jgi:calcineurin-like phosphoesterase family protein
LIYFTSDTHFGCDKLVENTRPQFTDCKQHDDHLIDMINSTVDRNDTLVIVGDFCKEKPGLYRPRIRCRHIQFILGNHDKEKKIRAVFGGNVWQQRMVKVGDQRVWCSHFPTCYWDRSHYGVAHAYGHLHYNREREQAMDKGMPGRRSMDVGVDAAKTLFGEYKPISSGLFFGMLSDRKGHDIIRKEDRWNLRDYKTGDQNDED